MGLPAEKVVTRIHIRWMIRRDMVEVLAIEATTPSPWNEEDFLKALRQRNCIGMVAELGEKVVGFMVYELEKNHLAVTRFAVDPKYRRQSIGKQMVAKLVSKLSYHRRTHIRAVVHEANLAGQLFCKAMGFRATEVLRNEFEDGDGFKMVYRFGDGEPVDEKETNRISQYED